MAESFRTLPLPFLIRRRAFDPFIQIPLIPMSVYQLSNDELLTLGARVLENSTQQPIADAMATVGYDEAAMQQGQTLYDAYEEAVQTRQAEYGEQQSATDALNDAWDAFHSETYMPHVKISRIIFDDGTQERLGITGNRPDAFAEYVQEARRFYDTIAGDENLQSTLAERGGDAETVTQAQTSLDQLEGLDQTQEREKAEAQQATRDRDDARRAFADWLADYRKFARVALSDQPELLEQLDITVPAE